MAKMKVYEVAKELDMPSKEIVAFLNDKGVEVKSHMSTIEDDAVSMIQKKFGAAVKSAVKADALKAEVPKIEKSKVEKMKEKEPKAEAPKTEVPKTEAPKTEVPKVEAPKAEVPKTEAPKAEDANSEEHKKKKNIIFVSNPHNSKMPGGQVQRPMGQQNRNGVGQNRQSNNTSSNLYQQPRPQQSAQSNQGPVTQNEGTAQSNSRPVSQGESRPQSNQNNRPAYNNNRPQGQYENRSQSQGSRPAYNDNRNQSGQSQGGNRPAYNNNRPQSGGQNSYARPASSGQGGYTRPAGTGQGGYTRPASSGQGGYTRPAGTGQGGYTRPAGNGQSSQGGNRPAYNNNRPQSGQGGYTRPTGGQNGQSAGRPYNNRPYQGRPNGGASTGDDRYGNNNDRGPRGNDREDSRFRKPGQGNKSFVPEAPAKDQEKHRDEEKRRISQEKDKRSKKDFIYEDDSKNIKGKNKAGKFIKPEKREEQIEERIKTIILPETLTIKELAEKMKIQPSSIVKKLFLQGQVVTVNQEITFEAAEEIAIEYEIMCEKEVKIDVIEELLKEEGEDDKDMTPRPPVVCVMGHVDHGKTSLLDAIRKTNVTDREAGGITQAIGAYTVKIKDQKITFLDTPGHEAFTAMRMRGANSTDIAILVVAADDGVMPQTVEAINHAKAAGIEIIVAVNKIDKPNANIDRVKQEMTEYELIPVDWGGTTEFVPVSAKSGEGIDTLLETVILTSEILELKADAKRKARGLVIEAELDKGRGPVATVLVQKGTLHVGDFISAGASHGKVRAMIDDKGKRVKEATPSTPVEILGLSDVPNAGEIFIAHENDKEAKGFAETFIAQNKVRLLDDTKAKMSLDDLFVQIQAGNLKELNIIIKADVQGSVEAVKQSLVKLSNEEVVVKVIHGGVGAINESDVILASASDAIIIGFNIRPDATAKVTAEHEGVDVRLYKVIYQAIEDVEAAMKGMLDPVYEEQVIGHAEIRQIFKASAIGNISGAYVLDGRFERGSKVRITREGKQIYEGELSSLKRFKDDVKEVKTGFECGLVFEEFDQTQELDIVEAYMMVEVPR